MKRVLSIPNRVALALLIVVLACVVPGERRTAVAQEPAAGAGVYAMTNTTGLNQVWAFSRSGNGALNFLGAFSTNGGGSGASLGSQGALALSADGAFLFAVNAGSNEISSFTVQSSGLTFVADVPSRGTTPVSLAVHGSLLYVLNAAGPSPNISGFTVGSTGALTPLPGSTRKLSSTAQPAQVGFDPRGTLLVVTERGTSKIDTFSVNSNGIAFGPLVQNSNGPGPAGFAFDALGHLIVAEAQNGAVSSYSLSGPTLTVISGSVADGSQGACCIVNSNNSGFPTLFSFTANTTSNTLSGYAIGSDGSLTLLSGDTPATAGPLDMAVSASRKFVYVLGASSGQVQGFAIQPDGSLHQVALMNGLPPSADGLAGN